MFLSSKIIKNSSFHFIFLSSSLSLFPSLSLCLSVSFFFQSLSLPVDLFILFDVLSVSSSSLSFFLSLHSPFLSLLFLLSFQLSRLIYFSPSLFSLLLSFLFFSFNILPLSLSLSIYLSLLLTHTRTRPLNHITPLSFLSSHRRIASTILINYLGYLYSKSGSLPGQKL